VRVRMQPAVSKKKSIQRCQGGERDAYSCRHRQQRSFGHRRMLQAVDEDGRGRTGSRARNIVSVRGMHVQCTGPPPLRVRACSEVSPPPKKKRKKKKKKIRPYGGGVPEQESKAPVWPLLW